MCTLKNEHVPPNGNTRGYMYPQTEIWVGMLYIDVQGEVLLTPRGTMTVATTSNQSGKMDHPEIERTFNIRKQQTLFYSVCSL